MKLNIGCGYQKISGYINIDINPEVKPDFIMPAHDLDFPNEHFNEILAKQVIEHLGFFKTKYFLSEAARTLKTGKFLTIETPHIEKSFELFLNSKSISERERVLGWIYGSETEYMGHVYCFPVELVESVLNEFGFEIYKKEFFDYEFLRPSVRYICIKKRKDINKNILRKNMVKNGVFFIKDEIYLSEFEKFILGLDLNKIEGFRLSETAFSSPIMSASLSSFLNDETERGKMAYLLENNFTGWIFEVMIKYLRDFRDRKRAFERVKEIFFDNPDVFIYNFIDNKRRSSIKIPILTEETFYYELNKRGIK